MPRGSARSPSKAPEASWIDLAKLGRASCNIVGSLKGGLVKPCATLRSRPRHESHRRDRQFVCWDLTLTRSDKIRFVCQRNSAGTGTIRGARSSESPIEIDPNDERSARVYRPFETLGVAWRHWKLPFAWCRTRWINPQDSVSDGSRIRLI